MCQQVDDFILAETTSLAQQYTAETGPAIEFGIAFPTCVCLHNVARHYAGQDDKEESAEVIDGVKNYRYFSSKDDFVSRIRFGHLVKIELGVQVNGYISTLAHSTVLRPDPDTPVMSRISDVRPTLAVRWLCAC